VDDIESAREPAPAPHSKRKAIVFLVSFCVALVLLIALNMK
jgi:hypothetical protein